MPNATTLLAAATLLAAVPLTASTAAARSHVPAAIATAGSGELVVDGGFEDPAIDDGSWQLFGEIRGWKTVRGPGLEIQRGAAGAPHAGAQLLELDSDASSAIAQTIDTTPNRTYRLSYWISPRPGLDPSNNALVIRWEGKIVDRYAATAVTDATAWEHHVVTVMAHGRGSVLTLEDASPSDSLGAYVDDVSVVEVPRGR